MSSPAKRPPRPRSTVVAHPQMVSRYLPPRDLHVYLPAAYASDPERRFPVLYLQDGQNLFDPARAFGGVSWRVDRAADRAVRVGTMAPVIVVGIDHGGERRIDEYTPARDVAKRAGGLAAVYARMLVDEVKPFIDGTYRTVPDAEVTGVGGSSLGALVALYAALQFPDVFGRAAVVSPSVWWGRRAIVRDVEALEAKPPLRVWLDVGTREGRQAVSDARALRDAMVAKGWRRRHDLHYREVRDAEHAEAAWATRAPELLSWLYPR